MGAPAILDRQQARTLAIQRFRKYGDNPKAAAHDLFADSHSPSGRLELTDYQADVARSVLQGKDTTWRSCHGAGKTTLEAVLVYLFLLLRPHAKVPTTAPTWHQVKNVLWAEIAKWYERFRLKEFFDLDKTKLAMRAAPDEWFAIGVASNKPTNIEGFHARHLLFIIDEAKGVANPIFDAVDGACTQGGIRLYCSTPGSRIGKFYESHHGRIARFFQAFHVSADQAPHVSAAWIALKREEWGVESPIYVAKVRGEFPQEGDDVMFPLSLLDAATDAFDEVDEAGQPTVPHLAGHYALGGDIARYGLNQTVVVGCSPTRMDRLTAWERQSIVETSDRIHTMYREQTAAGLPPVLIGIDDSGVGGGVTDTLRDRALPVLPVLFGGSPSDDGREYFVNLKAEMASNFRKILEENARARGAGQRGTFAMLKHDRLTGQLSNLRRRYGGAKGLLSLIDPDDPSVPASELPKGMKVSPDHAHAAIVAYYTSTSTKRATTESSVSETAPVRPTRPYSSMIFGRRPAPRLR